MRSREAATGDEYLEELKSVYASAGTMLEALDSGAAMAGEGRGTPGGPIAGYTPDIVIPAVRLATATDITAGR